MDRLFMLLSEICAALLTVSLVYHFLHTKEIIMLVMAIVFAVSTLVCHRVLKNEYRAKEE